MKNKMSIDEMVRQGIAQGEEPHNLGAWANMERMLDGKNPYQEEEKKERRPWLFFLLGFIALSTAVVGGYNYFNNPNTPNNNSVVANSPSNENESNNYGNEDASTNLEQNQFSETQQSTNTNNSTDQQLASNGNTQATMEAIRANEIKENLASNNLEEKIQTNSSARRSRTPRNNNFNSNTPSVAANNNTSSRQESLNKPNSDLVLASNTTDNVRKKTNDLAKKEAAKINRAESKAKEIISPTIVENYTDTQKVTEVSQRFVKDKLGNKKLVADSFEYNVVKEKQRTVINPRFVELTKEQEKAAQRRTAIASNSQIITPPTKPLIEAPTKVASASSDAKTLETKSKERNSFFSLFKRAGAAIKQKGISMAHTRTPIYTGMFLGVNAALVNSKHNFGGFQGGFTAMTPLSRLLTLRMEARLVNQNNSGYTVTDNRRVIRSHFIDSTTLTHSKIYNYEVDSVSYGYNLKDFYTIQVPVILNANIKKFNVYAGMHFNYGFRMNINTSTSASPMSISDTSSSASYVLRSDSKAKFVRDDFAQRLGLGYTIGGGYNFTPRINLDLRMSNLFWDNTAAAKKEISNVFFKIPNFQLSLGYKFRSFEIEE